MHKKDLLKGFTIIEIVLVLAIAGLIFLMVFVALPTLQRNERDTERKRSLMLISSSLDYRNRINKTPVSDGFSSRNGANGFCTFYKNYVGEELKDPSTGDSYKIALWGTKRVADCEKDITIDRGAFDMDVWVHPNKADDSWAKMEIGDIQFDNSAYCDGEVFNDNVGKSNGLKIYALRIRLEGGGYYCLDNTGETFKQN